MRIKEKNSFNNSTKKNKGSSVNKMQTVKTPVKRPVFDCKPAEKHLEPRKLQVCTLTLLISVFYVPYIFRALNFAYFVMFSWNMGQESKIMQKQKLLVFQMKEYVEKMAQISYQRI